MRVLVYDFVRLIACVYGLGVFVRVCVWCLCAMFVCGVCVGWCVLACVHVFVCLCVFALFV